jgi:hypothetical protein
MNISLAENIYFRIVHKSRAINQDDRWNQESLGEVSRPWTQKANLKSIKRLNTYPEKLTLT